jgi:hypothetical protein
MVKVLFLNNTAGEVNISQLNDMIKNSRIAAYCGPNGWVVVENPVKSQVLPEQKYRKGRRENMKLEEIREIAKKIGLNLGKQKKADSIRTIQNAEGNDPCFDTGKKNVCGQDSCLWREDCV